MVFKRANIAIIPIKGIIDPYLSEFVRFWIERFEKKRSIKVIVTEINSPGGFPVSGREIEYRLKECKKPTIAWVRDHACSAAYIISSACDHIVADEMSDVGAIGTVISRMDYSRYAKKKGIEEKVIASGEFKKSSVYQEMDEKEKKYLKNRIEQSAEIIYDELRKNRNFTDEQLKELESGKGYSGKRAKELNLVDSFGREKEVFDLAKKLGKLKKARKYHTYCPRTISLSGF